MIRRIQWDQLMQNAQILGMVLLGLAMLMLIIRLFRMPAEEIKRISELPLNDD